MYEMELKVRVDHATVRSRLESIGATRLGAVEQSDTYYDAPHRSFAETDEALRIRREADDTTERSATKITYKGALVDAESKTREERETRVEDGVAMDAILDALGFSPAATVAKRRERYRLDEFTITLDDVDGLGQFLEIETGTDASGLDDARDRAVDLLESLDLDPDAQLRTSYLSMLLEQQ